MIRLPLAAHDPSGSFLDLFQRQGANVRPFSLHNIACFLELSLGLSAWKSYGNNSWALRMNPSSGNLHPVEGYIVLPSAPNHTFSGGIYHYNPFEHGLAQRTILDESFRAPIRQHFPEGFFAALSSIHWRESWKYGERAFRYSHLDMGHAVAAMSFSATLLGWQFKYLNALSDQDVESILGFTKTRWKEFEREEAGPMLLVHPPRKDMPPRGMPADILRLFESLSFTGEPNLLSTRHRHWSVIDDVSAFTKKPATREETVRYDDHPFHRGKTSPITGAQVIRKRRSALAFDATTALAGTHFFDILDRTLPRNDCAPFDTELGRTAVHLLIFVHRVIGVDPGLYFLVRGNQDEAAIQQKCRQRFLWERTLGTRATLPLYTLERGDFRSLAASASCNQDIAADGAFAAAIIAEFRSVIEQEPYRYRQLHWEAGMVGQVLYLAAEAYGMRGTGMGCFFDDTIHNLLGFRDNAYQDLYHFGVGRPVEDTRIATLPPYSHLKK